VFSRVHLKWALLACLVIVATSAILQTGWIPALDAKDALGLLETGFAVCAAAICVALIATV
jgi:hypothetical protein